MCVCVCVCVCIYIYIYILRERTKSNFSKRNNNQMTFWYLDFFSYFQRTMKDVLRKDKFFFF